MKIKQLFILSLAAVVGMTACSKSNEEGSSASTSVILTIGAPTTASLDGYDATGGIVTGVTTSTISDLNIFFMNGNGVLGSYWVNASTTPSLSTVTNAAGYQFTGINGSATSVYIVANYGSDKSGLTTLSAIKALTKDMKVSQNSGVDGWKKVAMAGLGNIVAGTPKQAAVAIAPVVARMEIVQVSTDATITSFKLDGIFINNHSVDVNLAGAGVGALVNNSPVDNAAALLAYTAANYGGYSDLGAPSLVLAPAGKCYGYQVAPVAGDATGATYPHVILKLSSIVLADGSTATPAVQFVTARTYGTALNTTGFVANKVYRISDFKFSSKDLTTTPETEKQSVNVKVTVTPWSVQSITPDLQ